MRNQYEKVLEQQNNLKKKINMKVEAMSDKVEKEYKLEAYTDLDAFKDFNEMVIQFGYITLFAVALPIAPVLAVLNNFFEIRGDAFALCKGSRRRAYQSSLKLYRHHVQRR